MIPNPFDPVRVHAVHRALAAAFAGQAHDMWSGGRIHASPLRTGEVQALRKRNLDTLTPSELDQLVFKAISTIGGPATFKFFIWRFLVAVTSQSDGGWVSEDHVILPKLEEAQFDLWAERERVALLDVLSLWSQQQLARFGDYDFLLDPNDPAIVIADWVKARRQSR